MKKIKIVFILIVGAVLTSCGDSELPGFGNCVEVKMVTHVCGQTVLQVINPPVGLELSSFTSYDNDGNPYEIDNVFFTWILCHDDLSIYENGATFSVVLDEFDINPELDCIVCLALLANPPEARYNVTIVENCVLPLGDQL